MEKYVFILGAGFSVPLGGPLFRQLLTSELNVYWQRLHFDEQWTDVFAQIHDGGIQARLGMSLDAEQLLAKVQWMEDHANSDIAQLAMDGLWQLVPDSAKSISVFLHMLNKYLTHVLSAECEAYLDDLDADSDIWDPYDEWFRQLTNDDTIITFNYDTVIERLATRAGKEYDEAKLCEGSSNPRLIKIHGSATWSQYDKIEYLKRTDYLTPRAIGIPGLHKSKMHRDGHFKLLWDEAASEIEKATHVAIIGYSMPATDNRSRMMILRSLGAGADVKSNVSIVLGDDRQRIDRIMAITRPVVGHGAYGETHKPHKQPLVVDTQMYAQDFIAEYQRYSKVERQD